MEVAGCLRTYSTRIVPIMALRRYWQIAATLCLHHTSPGAAERPIATFSGRQTPSAFLSFRSYLHSTSVSLAGLRHNPPPIPTASGCMVFPGEGKLLSVFRPYWTV